MLTVNKKSDYGLLIISKLAADTSEYVSLSKLVEKTRLPQRFIARIAADLAKNGILASKEGKVGGYKLVKKLDDVTLYDYLSIFDKGISMTKINHADTKFDMTHMCVHNTFFSIKLSKILIKELSNWTLADFIKHN
jgi:Rrf2 family protein